MGIRNKRLLMVVRPADGGIREHVLHLYRYLARGNEVILAAPPASSLQEEARSQGFPAVDLPVKDGLHPFRDNRAIQALLAAAKQFNIQLIHAHGYKAALLARPVGRLTCTPVLVTVHNYPAWPSFLASGKRVWGLAEKYLQNYTQRYITVSCALEEMLVASGVNRQKITTIYNGINSKDFAPPDKGHVQQKKGKNVAMLGRLVGQKGPDLFLRALPPVIKRFPEASFEVAGDGPWKKKLITMTRKMSLQDKVTFVGRPLFVPTYLHQLDVLVIPSRSEGLCITALEALAAECPVVACRVGGIPEIVRHGQTGLLVPPEDPDRLADAVKFVLANPEYSQDLAHTGRLLVEKQFALHKMLKRTEKIYEEILQGITQKKGVVVKFASR